MTWLKYTDDEVLCFHSEFDTHANLALLQLGLHEQFRWEHHLRTVGVTVVPDFVLVEITNNRWRLVVEIKRPRSAVHSERSQIQAKGYAEANQNLYSPSKARYFCVTNLESTLLFAVNGSNRVQECRVDEMAFDSGAFGRTPANAHKQQFVSDFMILIGFVLRTAVPNFDVVWPRVARTLISHAASLTYDRSMDMSIGLVPPVVADYFGGSEYEIQKRELLLRCLVAEYLKGILSRHSHVRSPGLPLLRKDVRQAANIIDILKTIDFGGIFEPTAAAMYRNLESLPAIRAEVENYLEALISERIDILATRSDALEMPEAFIAEAYPHEVQDARGKARTDSDLAALLSAATIDRANMRVLDPGCGDGSLLSAAYDTLRAFGATHGESISRLNGIDADAIATKVAALRLALKEPFVIAPTDRNHIVPGDMFSSATIFADIDVVLMNPPFKRFEQRDAAAIPPSLRNHFRQAVTELSGVVETDVGQANIYNLYVEYVIKASTLGTVLGIILDNRWYHNKGSTKLRELLLRECEVIAVLSYPHDLFFDGWTIATSILIARKGQPSSDHKVHFVRTNDPRRVDFTLVSAAIHGAEQYPLGWAANVINQSSLGSDSWQHYFSRTLKEDFRTGLLSLNHLFSLTRSGRPDREGGGTETYALPFGRKEYGPRRKAKALPRVKYTTEKNGALSATDNDRLRRAANLIPPDLRGYAIVNSDDLTSYRISVNDVTKVEMLETPIQRAEQIQASYFSKNRRNWDSSLDYAVEEIRSDPYGGNYVALVESLIGLDETVLSREELWHGLREPYAGELVIPRKLRAGHRVHINPFPYDPTGRQVRISSNFFHYYNCISIDADSGLTRPIAVELIFSFLMSSFGQLQFEMEAYNREGVRSIEGHQLERIAVFDPRLIRPENRSAILAAATLLPYPVPTDCDPRTQPALQHLDELFADEIANRNSSINKTEMLGEVWNMLAEWTQARRE